MDLQVLWFCIVALFFGGYFVLEGFDFGVGLLLPFLPRDEQERSTMFRSIGPVWDGNEVWLVVAGGAMFAAFPAWYATMFSGFYIALLLLLVFLILRVLSFEWRERHEHSRWLWMWGWANTIACVGASLIWGVAFSALLYGTPIDSNGEASGSFWDLFNAYTLVGGVAVLLLFAFHGATYLTLRTTGGLCRRAAAAAGRLSIAAAVVGAAYLIWTVAVAIDRNDKDVFPPLLPALLAIGALLGAVVSVRVGRSGWAFLLTAAGAFLVPATIFTSLYPRVMVSSTSHSYSLTVDAAASAHYTLAVMSVVALVVAPVVLLYQGWTYHVFRERIGGEEPLEKTGPAGGAPETPPATAPGEPTV
jgi:cytochrome d ubiquinol oxidase subunit II